MPRFTVNQLASIGAKIFASAGAPIAEAETVGRLLANANLVGHDSHGVIRIPQYLQFIESGNLTLNLQSCSPGLFKILPNLLSEGVPGMFNLLLLLTTTINAISSYSSDIMASGNAIIHLKLKFINIQLASQSAPPLY